MICLTIHNLNHICTVLRAQELCGSRGGHPGLPIVPNRPYSLCGRKATLKESTDLTYWTGTGVVVDSVVALLKSLAGVTDTVVNVGLAVSAREAGDAGAAVLLLRRRRAAGGIVLARLQEGASVVHLAAVLPHPLGRAAARVVVDPVHAGGCVLTGVGVTVVDVGLAVKACNIPGQQR